MNNQLKATSYIEHESGDVREKRGTSLIIGQKRTGKTQLAIRLAISLKKETVIIFDASNEYAYCDLKEKAHREFNKKQFDEIVNVIKQRAKKKRVFRIINKEMAVRLIEYGLSNCSLIVEYDKLYMSGWLTQNSFRMALMAICAVNRIKNIDLLIVAEMPELKFQQNASQAIIFKHPRTKRLHQSFISETDYIVLQSLPQ